MSTPSLLSLLMSLITLGGKSRQIEQLIHTTKEGVASFIPVTNIPKLIPKGASGDTIDFVYLNRVLLETSTRDVVAKGYEKAQASYKASSVTIKVMTILLGLVGLLIFIPLLISIMIGVFKTDEDKKRYFLLIVFGVVAIIPLLFIDK